MIKRIILIFTGIILSMCGVAQETLDTLILDEMQSEFSLVEGSKYDVVILPRTVKAGMWSTMVLPFTTQCPEGWQVKEMTRVTVKPDGNINLGFSDATEMKAGQPYMVRVEEEINEVVFKNIVIDTELRPTIIDDLVSFTGTYTLGSVPLYGHFISDNKFYRSVKEGTNKVRAYRAFFIVTDETKASEYTLRGEGEDSEGVSIRPQDKEGIKVYYDLLGNKRDELRSGINLIEYNDGTVVKKIIP